MELKLISILFKGKKTLIYSLEFNINIVDIIVNYLLSYLYCAMCILDHIKKFGQKSLILEREYR